jgi:hypothetical protein
LERALPFFASVFAHEIKEAPPEDLPVQKLIFDESMHGFDVALPGVAAASAPPEEQKQLILPPSAQHFDRNQRGVMMYPALPTLD